MQDLAAIHPFFDSPCMSQETRIVGLLKSTTPHETLSCTLLDIYT